MWPMLALAAVQAVSNQDKEDRDRKLASATQRYSPWTRLAAQPIEHANPVGDLAQGYGAYLGQEQATENNALRKRLLEAQIRSLDRGGNPFAGAKALPAGSSEWGDWNPNYSMG